MLIIAKAEGDNYSIKSTVEYFDEDKVLAKSLSANMISNILMLFKNKYGEEETQTLILLTHILLETKNNDPE